MSSPEQLRQEAFADAVERAATVRTAYPFWQSTSDPLRVRVTINDGRQLEFRLKEVDLDGQQLVGLTLDGAPQSIPLAGVRTVWYRRPLVWRSAAVWVSGGLAGALLGFRTSAVAAMFGALIGLASGAFVSWLLHDSRAMYEWTQLYNRGAA